MRMSTYRQDDLVTLGPCPGCQLWQLDYTHEVVKEFAQWRVEKVYEFGSDELADAIPYVDLDDFYAAVEGVLQDHLEECVHLQRLYFGAL